MGPTQGKLANTNAIRVLSQLKGQTVPETGVTTSRPFYHPVPLSHLAGRGFHPHRLTALHTRHLAAGAVLMPAGEWQRPAYYAALRGQGFAGPGGAPGRALGGPRGALGGLLDTSTPSVALVAALRTNASSYTWVAAAVGSNSAAGVQLASGLPVMAIGGFNGTDPTPTLAAFQTLVKAGKVHYFLASGGGGRGGFSGGPGGGPSSGSASSSAITSWVEQTFTATTIGGVTVYDLTATA